ncbi:hypothetical protein HCG45_15095 [Pseudomonas fulva]|uniref:hypothetical protein n=1 Tax=Pseudomonas fulva TaxID=47880 RepID=UPI001428B953|nr:hypothetical protein [Pseudomonas fulva]NIX94069.1 hypothetical protein [Pseudomonas fulva]
MKDVSNALVANLEFELARGLVKDIWTERYYSTGQRACADLIEEPLESLIKISYLHLLSIANPRWVVLNLRQAACRYQLAMGEGAGFVLVGNHADA